MTKEREALKALIHEMEYVLSCINAEEIPFDGDDFHEALRLGKEALDHLAQPEQEKERCVGCEACIDTACGRDECPKGWPKAAQPEQEPVAYGMWDTMIGCGGRMMMVRLDKGQDGCTVPLYTTPPQRTWVGLTDEERNEITNTVMIDIWQVARAIEAKLRSKNGY